ncbi:MAG: ferrochelatase [Rhodospirillaceae bacterium]|nr:ferrochelatase [Rhodospirillaceae bacterium]OUT77413.1 MAG: ferrochelatase [Rhodospirillaceae bacterium TMED23]
MKKRAIILFNLGGPNNSDAVRPFLFNLFNDPAIINVPNPMRWLIAKLISYKRSPIAKEIYNEIGGKSPILELTQQQAKALELGINNDPENEFKVFIVMRYWHPMSMDVVPNVKKYNPDEILLLPLYPHFSSTTSGSSIKDWHKTAKKAGLKKLTKIICCYPTEINLIKAHSELLQKEIKKSNNNPRILFSAHGLPKKIINKGDPYQAHIEKTALAIANEVKLKNKDWSICYQSRVGPLEWIGPSLDEELTRASNDNIGVIVLPIAFVSEHSETLVELDIEYKKLAMDLKIPTYQRVPAVGTNVNFIASLIQMVRNSISETKDKSSNTGSRICPLDRSCHSYD